MTGSMRLAAALLTTTALAMPGPAYAQSEPAMAADAPSSGEDVAEQAAEPQPEEEEEVDVSIPGGGNTIVVTGNRDRNLAKASDQVIAVLSSTEIARTGEGNIAGALGRVTGLSVVGNGLV